MLLPKKTGMTLFNSTDRSNWTGYFRNYEKVLTIYSEKKKKKDLISLDNWLQAKLGKEIQNRDGDHYLKKEELVKLMKWKLTRGKFRPRLTELIQTNPDELVKTASTESFKTIANPSKAVQELCRLKAVGPATASGILTAYCPEQYAFMSDESVGCVLNGKIDYTLKYYLQYLEKITEKASKLSKGECPWTPHDVELALWTWKVSKQLDIDVEEDASVVRFTKRKSEENSTLPSKKKLKT